MNEAMPEAFELAQAEQWPHANPRRKGEGYLSAAMQSNWITWQAALASPCCRLTPQEHVEGLRSTMPPLHRMTPIDYYGQRAYVMDALVTEEFVGRRVYTFKLDIGATITIVIKDYTLPV